MPVSDTSSFQQTFCVYADAFEDVDSIFDFTVIPFIKNGVDQRFLLFHTGFHVLPARIRDAGKHLAAVLRTRLPVQEALVLKLVYDVSDTAAAHEHPLADRLDRLVALV